MRSVGLGLALVASIQFAVAPAFAQDPAKPAPAPATTATAPATPAPAAAPGMVIVHINTDKKVTLEKRASSTSPWEHVCNSPCDVATSVSDQYQVLGDDLNESRPFMLDAAGGDKITLDVTPGVHNKAARGGWILAAGALVIVGGAVTILAGSKSTTAPGNDGTVTDDSNTNFVSAGSIAIAVGVILAITGGAFMYDNAHTKVEGSIGDVTADSGHASVKANLKVTADRSPTWHEDTGPQLLPSRVVSIFHGTF
jgi:hypothetical protein